MKKLLSILMLLSLILVSCEKDLDPKDIARETKVVSIVNYINSAEDIIPAVFTVQVYFSGEEIDVFEVVTPIDVLENIRAWEDQYQLKYGDVLELRIVRLINLTCEVKFLFSNYSQLEEVAIPTGFTTIITYEHIGERNLEFKTFTDKT